MANNFLPFCATDTGTNLLSQSDYAASSGRTGGNVPGIASAKLNNKALRQASYIAGQYAQFLADITGTDVLDDATPARLLAQIESSLQMFAPKVTKYTSGSGTFAITRIFMVASANATSTATYTNNGHTYTVVATIAAGTQLYLTGDGAPSASGTLTKASGTGDSTITFYAVRSPQYIRVRLVGAGGGGAGSSANNGGAGGDTTFGTTLLSGSGGAGGISQGAGGAGGAASLGSGPVGIALAGGNGMAGSNSAGAGLGGGASSPFGGAGGSAKDTTGIAGVSNTGSGGSGGATWASFSGAGGGAGGYVDAIINGPLSTYAYGVGAAGAAGAAGTLAGGAGGSGVILVEEHY